MINLLALFFMKVFPFQFLLGDTNKLTKKCKKKTKSKSKNKKTHSAVPNKWFTYRGDSLIKAFREEYPGLWSDAEFALKYDTEFFSRSLTTLAELRTDLEKDLHSAVQPIPTKRYGNISHYSHPNNPYAVWKIMNSKTPINDYKQQGVTYYLDLATHKWVEGVYWADQSFFMTFNIYFPQGDINEQTQSPIVMYQTKAGIPDTDFIYNGIEAVYFMGESQTYIYYDIIVEDLPTIHKYRNSIYIPAAFGSFTSTFNGIDSPVDKFSATPFDSPFVTESTNTTTIIDQLVNHYNNVLLKECTDEERVIFEKYHPVQNLHNRASPFSPSIVFNAV